MTTQVLLLTGRGRYADPWHPFERTSARLRELLGPAGFDIVEPQDVDTALESYVRAPLPGLLIANLGKPRDGAASPALEAVGGLERLLGSTPVLALHAAANSFPHSELWARTLGARWVDGHSWHPEFGETEAVPVTAEASVGALSRFTLQDERYLDLVNGVPRTILYSHDDDAGGMQPSVWVRETDGLRAAYDAYGHDERSYESEGHRELILRLVQWLVRSEEK